MKALLPFFIAALCAAGLTPPAVPAQQPQSVDPSQWRGFNLLEKFTLRGNAPFKEDDFRWIAELGFNFVRLPMDYRSYTEPDHWEKFKEPVLKEIDQAIEFGAKHRMHVCLNLHRAPGYCINPPAEAQDLWKDASAQDAFVAHWVMFARRYKGIPSGQLSFNLLNEPARNTRESYLKVNVRTIEAIHAVDPSRLIIVDGNNVGRDPTPELLRYGNIIQATRGYHPGTISHYKASWAQGSDQWPEPVWPPAQLVGHLYGPSKPELKSALVLRGDLQPGTEIALKIQQLSFKARVQAHADGKVVLERMFDPKTNPTNWKAMPSDSGWTYHQPAGQLNFQFTLSSAARQVTIENVDGDWLKFSELQFRMPGGPRQTFPSDLSWGRRQSTHQIGPDGRLLPPSGTNPDPTLVDYLKPWRDLSAQGGAVFVGEWGCYNKTPHPVALAWMRSWLDQWKQARFGWALWNFRGSFGVLDSGRTDVQYEDWHGHKLDREMLKLLQEYLKH